MFEKKHLIYTFSLASLKKTDIKLVYFIDRMKYHYSNTSVSFVKGRLLSV